MVPIDKFPYECDDLCLFQLQSGTYGLGHYHSDMDTFKICISGLVDSIFRSYDAKRFLDKESVWWCQLPSQFLYDWGPGKIRSFAPLTEYLDMPKENIQDLLTQGTYGTPCLIGLQNKQVLVSEVSSFSDVGRAFRATRPAMYNRTIYHTYQPLEAKQIEWAITL